MAPDLSSETKEDFGEVLLLDPLTGKERLVLKGPKTFADCTAHSPDGKTPAVGWRNETVQFWDVATGKESSTLKLTGNTRHLAYVRDVRVSSVVWARYRVTVVRRPIWVTVSVTGTINVTV